MIAVAVLGHGVVGSGVVEVLERSRASISKKAGTDLYVKKILDIRDFSHLPYGHLFTKSFDEIVSDPEIRVVVEVMGGISPAFEYVSAALRAGKSVVTSNKELVAAKGAALVQLAREHGQNFLFEASVGGGTPIIRPLHQSLVADEIDEIVGILNGTTNFILTKMIQENMGFDEALKIAQKLGYAEANPAADVEGLDTCRKICILASLAFGSHVYPDKVEMQGITNITLEDVQYAEDENCVIKLLGQTRRINGKCFVSTGPCLVSKGSPLARVDDVFNAILVRGEVTGDVVFYGKGAGKLPTASAVVSDIIDCVTAEGPIATLQWSDSDGSNVIDAREDICPRYLRCRGQGLLAKIGAVFGEVHILRRPGKPADEEAFTTAPVSGYELEEKLAALASQGVEVLSNLRVWRP
ncbi:MAG TPA: homoserine dehydrogenase [Clostridiales bacterium]|nr:homoserine dehydrogenase [Clostridiales bacterium]